MNNTAFRSTKSWTKFFDFKWQAWLANNPRISSIQFIEADDLRSTEEHLRFEISEII